MALPSVGVMCLLLTASTARAQEDAGANPSAQPAAQPARPPVEPAPPEHPDGVETTDVWFQFSADYADQLIARGRIRETVEEYFACGALRPAELDKLAEGAVMMVNRGGRLPGGLDQDSENYRIVEDLIRAAVARGGKGDARLAYAIGRLRFVDLAWSESWTMLKEAFEKGHDPERTKRWLYRATVNRADLLIKAYRMDEAIDELTEVIADSPPDADGKPRDWMLAARINLAVAHRRREERVESERILRELVEEYPDQPAPWNTLGQVLFDQGRLEEALEAYRTSMSLAAQTGAGTEDTLVSVAHVLYKLGRLEESEQVLQTYLSRRRDAPSGLYLMAQLQRDRGERLEAIRTLRRAHRLAEDDGSILLLLSQLHYERDEITQAEAVKERLEALRARLRGGGDEPEPDPDADPSADPDSEETKPTDPE